MVHFMVEVKGQLLKKNKAQCPPVQQCTICMLDEADYFIREYIYFVHFYGIELSIFAF